MTTETGYELVHPATGELVDLKASTTTDLADAADHLSELFSRLQEFRQAIINEVAERMDRHNTRTEQVGGWKLETNAPTSETYPVDALKEALLELVEQDVLDPEVLSKVIRYPDPKPPEPKIDKREINKLKGAEDPRVGVALDEVRVRAPQKRTLKLERAKR